MTRTERDQGEDLKRRAENAIETQRGLYQRFTGEPLPATQVRREIKQSAFRHDIGVVAFATLLFLLLFTYNRWNIDQNENLIRGHEGRLSHEGTAEILENASDARLQIIVRLDTIEVKLDSVLTVLKHR